MLKDVKEDGGKMLQRLVRFQCTTHADVVPLLVRGLPVLLGPCRQLCEHLATRSTKPSLGECDHEQRAREQNAIARRWRKSSRLKALLGGNR